jgi:fermentation-respiration switch protein FrsA (DUF1100 family)
MSLSASKRFAVRIAAVVIVLSITVLLGVGWIGSERAIHPRVAHYPKSLADFPDLRPQEVSFESRTHTRIAAEFFPGERHTTIVLSHGYGDNQAQMLPYAEFLHQKGFSILTYDMRNRGHSGGDAVTLGGLEHLDLMSAVDYLVTRPDVDRDRIGAMGVSLGASTTLLAAADDARIKAVLDDSGFSDAPKVIGSSFEHFIGLPPFLFAPVTLSIVHLRTGIDVGAVRPVDVIWRISPRPLLIIHCMNDTVVPPDNSDRNFAAARDPKQFWRISTGGHIDGLKVAHDEYERRVSQFFDESLR